MWLKFILYIYNNEEKALKNQYSLLTKVYV